MEPGEFVEVEELVPKARVPLKIADGMYPAELMKMERSAAPRSGDADYYRWTFLVRLPDYEDAQQMLGTTSLSIGELSKARKWARAILQRDLPMIETIKVADLRFRPCRVIVENQASGWAKIVGVMAAADGQLPLPHTPTSSGNGTHDEEDIPF